jgi:hypothetical protein
MNSNPEADRKGREPRFFDTARKNEQVLRGVLEDLQQRSPYFPTDFDFALPIDDILKRYGASPIRNSYGRFTINNFIVGPDEEASWHVANDEAVIDVYPSSMNLQIREKLYTIS